VGVVPLPREHGREALAPRLLHCGEDAKLVVDQHIVLGRVAPSHVVERLGARGPTVILSDGDVVFQPRKVERSGLWEAVEGRVLIYIHKEQVLDDVETRYPAGHYVMVDDKLRILTAMKQVWGNRLTTVFPRQGHYALDPNNLATYPPADVTVERIGDLIDYDLTTLLDTVQKGSMKR
jgi:hypothetical protein